MGKYKDSTPDTSKHTCFSLYHHSSKQNLLKLKYDSLTRSHQDEGIGRGPWQSLENCLEQALKQMCSGDNSARSSPCAWLTAQRSGHERHARENSFTSVFKIFHNVVVKKVTLLSVTMKYNLQGDFDHSQSSEFI